MAHWECLVARSLQEAHLADVVAGMVVDIASASDGQMLSSPAMARHSTDVVPPLAMEVSCVPYWQMRSSQAVLH